MPRIDSNSTDEDVVKFFIWDGQSAEEAVEFAKKYVRPNMLPPTDLLMQSYKNYENSFEK